MKVRRTTRFKKGYQSVGRIVSRMTNDQRPRTKDERRRTNDEGSFGERRTGSGRGTEGSGYDRAGLAVDQQTGWAVHKFEKLEVWQLAIKYVDACYAIADQLPEQERYNLASQLRRAAVSVAVNVAEGSTSQTDPEQDRSVRFAIRSLIETVACQHLIHRRGYLGDTAPLRAAYEESETLVAKLQALRRALGDTSVREDTLNYEISSRTPFDE